MVVTPENTGFYINLPGDRSPFLCMMYRIARVARYVDMNLPLIRAISIIHSKSYGSIVLVALLAGSVLATTTTTFAAPKDPAANADDQGSKRSGEIDPVRFQNSAEHKTR